MSIFKKKPQLKVGQIWQSENEDPFMICPENIILDIKDKYILFRIQYDFPNSPEPKTKSCPEYYFRMFYPVLLKDVEE